MESWEYGNPEDIRDGLIARTEWMERADARKDERPARQRNDRYYIQSRSIHWRELVRLRKLGKHHDRA